MAIEGIVVEVGKVAGLCTGLKLARAAGIGPTRDGGAIVGTISATGTGESTGGNGFEREIRNEDGGGRGGDPFRPDLPG